MAANDSTRSASLGDEIDNLFGVAAFIECAESHLSHLEVPGSASAASTLRVAREKLSKTISFIDAMIGREDANNA